MNVRGWCLVGLVWLAEAGCWRNPREDAEMLCTYAQYDETLARSNTVDHLVVEDDQIEWRSQQLRRWRRVEPRNDASVGGDAVSAQDQDLRRFLQSAAAEARAMEAFNDAVVRFLDAVGTHGHTQQTEPDAVFVSVASSLAAARTQAEAANRDAGLVLAASYEWQERTYSSILEGLARHPQDGSPLMTRLSQLESAAQTEAIAIGDIETLVTINCALDWSRYPSLHNEEQGPGQPDRLRTPPSRQTVTEALIRQRLAEIERRRAEVAEVVRRPAVTLLPEASIEQPMGVFRTAIQRRQQVCRGVVLGDHRA